MKKLLTVASIFLLICFSLSAVTISSPAATVNLTKNKVITMDTLNKEVEFYKNNGYSVSTTDVLNSLIDEILIEQGAQRDGYSVSDSDVESLYASQKQSVSQQAGTTLSDDEFKKIVEESYGSVDEYKSYLKEQYLTQIYVAGAKADLLANVKDPTESEIKTWYRQNSSSFMMPEMVRLSIIAKEKTDDAASNNKKKAELEEAYKKISSNQLTFEKAVQQYSEDSSCLSNGGDWGFMSDNENTRSSMGDEFVDAVMLLEPGDITKVFETPYLYVIAKCTVHQDPKVLSLTDTIEDYGITVHDYIYQGLVYQNSQYAFLNAYNTLVAELRNQAKINIIYKEQ